MMKIEEIVGDVVMLVLDNHEPLKTLGIDQNHIYASIVGYDEYGVWIRHPNFQIPKPPGKETKNKNLKKQIVPASILIPWGFLASIVHFPGVEGFDFPSPFEQHIGFEM